MKEQKKTCLIAVRISVEEKAMLETLKEKHFLNVSRFFREMIRKLYDEKQKLS